MHNEFWHGKKVLVTGAAGFIGSHTVFELANRGAVVGATIRSTPAKGVALSIPVDTNMEGRIREFQPQIIVHLATKFLSDHVEKDIPSLVDSNITLGTRVLNTATDMGVRVLTTSSAWQHFEGREYSPVSLYAATKQALITVAEYYKLSGLDFRELVLFDSYGAHDLRGKLVSRLVEAAWSGQSIDMGPGNQLIDLLYVSDTVSAILTLAELETVEQSTFVARSDDPISIKELVAKIELVTGRQINANWGRRESRPREMVDNWQFGNSVPSWGPRVSLEAGLTHCWRELAQDA
jgi:nucleoside-diphosphate-sugar epimerase